MEMIGELRGGSIKRGGENGGTSEHVRDSRRDLCKSLEETGGSRPRGHCWQSKQVFPLRKERPAQRDGKPGYGAGRRIEWDKLGVSSHRVPPRVTVLQRNGTSRGGGCGNKDKHCCSGGQGVRD